MTRERGEQDERERLESVIRGLGTLGYTREAHDIADLIYRATSAEADRARLLAENAALQGRCQAAELRESQVLGYWKQAKVQVSELHAELDAAEARVQALEGALKAVVEHARPAFAHSPFRRSLDAAKAALAPSQGAGE